MVYCMCRPGWQRCDNFSISEAGHRGNLGSTYFESINHVQQNYYLHHEQFYLNNQQRNIHKTYQSEYFTCTTSLYDTLHSQLIAVGKGNDWQGKRNVHLSTNIYCFLNLVFLLQTDRQILFPQGKWGEKSRMHMIHNHGSHAGPIWRNPCVQTSLHTLSSTVQTHTHTYADQPTYTQKHMHLHRTVLLVLLLMDCTKSSTGQRKRSTDKEIARVACAFHSEPPTDQQKGARCVTN